MLICNLVGLLWESMTCQFPEMGIRVGYFGRAVRGTCDVHGVGTSTNECVFAHK